MDRGAWWAAVHGVRVRQDLPTKQKVSCYYLPHRLIFVYITNMHIFYVKHISDYRSYFKCFHFLLITVLAKIILFCRIHGVQY